MKKGFTILGLVLLGYVLIPFNSLTYVTTANKKVLTRIDRKSLFGGGAYFTPGRYKSRWSLPKQYVKPYYARAGYQEGSFELIATWKGDTCIIYTFDIYSDTVKLSHTFTYRYAKDYKTWLRMKNDKSGNFVYINHLQ